MSHVEDALKWADASAADAEPWVAALGGRHQPSVLAAEVRRLQALVVRLEENARNAHAVYLEQCEHSDAITAAGELLRAKLERFGGYVDAELDRRDFRTLAFAEELEAALKDE